MSKIYDGPGDPNTHRGMLTALRWRGYEASAKEKREIQGITYPAHFVINPDTDGVVYWVSGESWNSPGKELGKDSRISVGPFTSKDLKHDKIGQVAPYRPEKDAGPWFQQMQQTRGKPDTAKTPKPIEREIDDSFMDDFQDVSTFEKTEKTDDFEKTGFK